MSDDPRMHPQEALPCARCQPVEAENLHLRQAIATLQAENNELAEELAGSRGTQRTLERQLRQARTELSKQRKEDPLADTIERLLLVWMRETDRLDRKGRKPNIAVDGSRGQLVAKALKMQNSRTLEPFTEHDLTLAFIGLGLVPYVSDAGRQPTGPAAKRYDDVQYALKDERTIERFIAEARRQGRDAVDGKESVWGVWQRISAMEQRWARWTLDVTVAKENGVSGQELFELLLRRDQEADAEWVRILSMDLHEATNVVPIRREAA